MTEETQQERFRNLIRVLENVIENELLFDLGTWSDAATPEIALECGTSACAIGYAAIDPYFRGIGLHLELEPDKQWLVPVYNEKSLFAAAAELFGINIHDANLLFSPDHYMPSNSQNPRAVLERVETYVLRSQIQGVVV